MNYQDTKTANEQPRRGRGWRFLKRLVAALLPFIEREVKKKQR